MATLSQRMSGSVAQTLGAAASRLERAGVSAPRRDAELLLARLLDSDPGGLIVRRTDDLDPVVAARFDEWIARRETRVPLQHVTGNQEFYGLTFRVDRRALVPRPETEGLVDAALAIDGLDTARVADLGTGGGCIAVTLAVRRGRLRLHALDRSAPAIELARENARDHGVRERIEFVVSDFAAAPADWNGRLDLVLSNPPYVGEAEWRTLEPEVRLHDPREALVPGPSGLEAYGSLLPAAARLLRPGGTLILELGYGQAAKVEEIVRTQPFEAIGVRPDLRGVPRVLVARRSRGSA